MTEKAIIMTALVLIVVCSIGAGWGAKRGTACRDAVEAGLYAEAMDQKLDEVFYYCNTTKGRQDEKCTPELLMGLAAQSLQNHEAFIKAASKCVPIQFIENNDGKKNKNHI